ncbi:MAG: aminotransferase class I/II-fold pyridoxal phosphate-dependent enzyme [Alphaproteobacteria bacterium]|nr:aminotransferase class I/II-fold pyridoxal phosphate-dependent enzyme [Alphaproteobacteria bacterium]
MPPEISTFAQSLGGSTVVAMRRKADALEAAGMEIVDFGIGEPDFDVPEPVKAAAIAAIQGGHGKYVDPAGLPQLRESICRFEKQCHGTDAPPENIVVTNGSYGALSMIMRAILNPGDEVLLIEPCWGPYRQMVRLCGAVPVGVPMPTVEGRFVLEKEPIADALTTRTRAIIVNTPWNPTGRVLSREELTAVAAVAERHDLWIVADEVYSELIYDGAEHVSVATISPETAARSVIASSLSKSFAMTGWRLGYCIAPPDLAAVLTKINHTTTRCAPSIVQHAAVAAFEEGLPSVEAMRDEYARRARAVARGLNQIEGVICPVPEGTFYALAQIPEQWGGSAAVADDLLTKAGVIVTPGAAYGPSCEHYIRLSFATSMDIIEEGLTRLRRALPPS